MRELDELEDLLRQIQSRLPEGEKEMVRDRIQYARDAFTLLQSKYLEAIRDRAVVQALLKKTSDDLIRQYRVIFENAGTAMVMLERDGTISLVNSYFEDLVGTTRDTIEERKKFSDFADDRLNAIVGHLPLQERGDLPDTSQYGEGRITGVENSQFDVFVRVGRLPETGQYILSIVDITARKRVEEELRVNREYLTQIFSTLKAGIMIIDARTHEILDVNTAAASLIGLLPDEIIGNTCHRHICPADVGMCPITDLHQTIDNSERVIINKSGVAVPIIKHAVPLTLHGRECLLETFIDNTERKKAEEALRQANRKLNLLGSITRHDINNKFMILRGYLDITARRSKDPSEREYFQKMESVLDTIQSQIAFTGIYRDLGTGVPKWQELGTLLPRSHVPETVRMAADIGTVWVFADPMLEKVFYNLLDNSLRHGQHVTEIHVSHRLTDGGLLIIWEDNGVGIAKEEKDKIFERGYGKNTGLGMFLVREILSLTGMTIRETGMEGTGARFEILVPKEAYKYGITETRDHDSPDAFSSHTGNLDLSI